MRGKDLTNSLVQWIEGGAINSWVLGSAWVWPTLEILHFAGLSLLLGAMLVVDLRMAGFIRQMSVAAIPRLLPLAAIGFAINLITGSLFFFGDPARYSVNIGFRIKMILVIVAGLNALWFYLRVEPYLKSWEAHGDTPRIAKVIAVASLGTWLGILLLGRLIPYVGTG